MVGIIAVHCGAGTHNSDLFKEYKRLTNKACLKAIQVLDNGGTSLEAVREAVMILENDPLTNSGFGSNLTLDGIVENDASVMDGKTLSFGGCGSIKRVKNPVALAYDLCIKQTIDLPLGLIPPSLLVGDGGLAYAKKIGLQIVNHEDLVSRKARRQFTRYKNMLDRVVQQRQLDTVGAVCVDEYGEVAAACSSGGILLKRPGRVGQAALYASGTWADSSEKTKQHSVAVCTTGCGEHLVQTLLAKEIADDLKSSTYLTECLHQTMNDKFLRSKHLQNVRIKLAGALVLHKDKTTGDVVLLWGHSTHSMFVGYMGTEDEESKALLSVLPENIQEGAAVNVGGSYYQNRYR
ncbi:threonine aspartase 1 [Diorhabda carinulata]|uniref:threonine aspartase 1 n=1 Tax=Diorhabda carinulata TaxID=1163345 RepID=UPI0024E0F11A|nr:threonine aspartase 1 isoform X2 [Diorhabda sublineata]XP_057651879.1 threonine aspartase 1 [Diorhabda carinulata]